MQHRQRRERSTTRKERPPLKGDHHPKAPPPKRREEGENSTTTQHNEEGKHRHPKRERRESTNPPKEEGRVDGGKQHPLKRSRRGRQRGKYRPPTHPPHTEKKQTKSTPYTAANTAPHDAFPLTATHCFSYFNLQLMCFISYQVQISLGITCRLSHLSIYQHYTLFMVFYPTVRFCLTADHISTCLMMFSARFKMVLVCSGDVVNGSAVPVLISDDGISGTRQHP